MAENLMTSAHKATNETYRDNYDRIFSPGNWERNFRHRLNVKLEAKRRERKGRVIKYIKPPRYDDVYFEGLDWLNKHG